MQKILLSKKEFETQLNKRVNFMYNINEYIRDLPENPYAYEIKIQELFNMFDQWQNSNRFWYKYTFSIQPYYGIGSNSRSYLFDIHNINTQELISEINYEFSILTNEIKQPYEEGYLKFYTLKDKLIDTTIKIVQPSFRYIFSIVDKIIKHDLLIVILILIIFSSVAPYLPPEAKQIITNYINPQ
jgi:hypothetical protein